MFSHTRAYSNYREDRPNRVPFCASLQTVTAPVCDFLIEKYTLRHREETLQKITHHTTRTSLPAFGIFPTRLPFRNALQGFLHPGFNTPA